MGMLEAWKNSDIFENSLCFITTIIPGSEPPCIIQMTEATLGKFICHTDGFHSLMLVPSQKTTLNSLKTSKLDEL